MKIPFSGMFAAALFATSINSASAQSLGAAANYDIFIRPQGTLELKDANQLFGQVGLSNSSLLDGRNESTTFDGTIFKHTGATIKGGSGLNPSGGIQSSASIDAALNQAVIDLNNYTNYLAGLTATGGGTNLSVTNSSVLNSSGSLNVLDYKKIDLENGETFTINGSAGGTDVFVIRVNDAFEFKAADLVLNNLKVDNVIWYYTGTNNFELHKSDSNPDNFMKFAGTVIATKAKDIRLGEVDFTGRVYAGGKDSTLKMGSGFKFEGAIPEPSSSLMLLLGAGGLLLRRRR